MANGKLSRVVDRHKLSFEEEESVVTGETTASDRGRASANARTRDAGREVKPRFALGVRDLAKSAARNVDSMRTYDAASLAALAKAQMTVKERRETATEGGGEDGDEEEGTRGHLKRSTLDVFGRSGEWLPPPPPREDAQMGIPDEKTIAAAKARREAARMKSSGTREADFIDIDSGREHANERVRFQAERERRAFGAYAEGDVLAGSDGEDAEEFERAQLSRVFKDEPEMKRTVALVKSSTSGGKTPSASIEHEGSEALASLRRSLAMAEASSANATLESARADDHAVKSKEALSFYEKELKGASERYVYTQKLRDYFRDACAMLHHKMPIVEELEAHYRKFHALRAEALTIAENVEREEAKIEATAASEAVNAVLGRGGSHAEASAAALVAVEHAVFRAKHLDSKNVDDMGRDLNIRIRDAAQERSNRRRANGSRVSTVSEDERQVSLFHKDWAEARQAAEAILQDVSEEFSTVRGVKKRAEEWKRTHPSSYKNTYMSISVPKLFAPFVRIQLIGWSPLFPRQGASAPNGLDSMPWHGDLFDYGLADGGAADANDEDSNLLPNIVQHVVLPIVSEAVEEWWDPRDASQSRALASTLKDVFIYVDPATNEDAKEVEMSLNRKLKRCAEEDCAVPTYSPIICRCAPDVNRHAATRFHSCLDVIRGALSFEGVLDRLTLQRIVCDVIIAKHIAPYVRLLLVDPSTCASASRALVDILPIDWMRVAPPSLASMRDIASSLQQLANATEVDAATAADISRVVDRLAVGR